MIKITPDISLCDISLGGASRNENTKDTQFAIMDRFFELGGNCFDSARVYGGGQSDVLLGEWIRTRGVRDKIIVCAKGNHPPLTNRFQSRLEKQDIYDEVNECLEKIGTDYLDLYLLHRDDLKKPVGEIMEPLHELVKAGKIRAIGCSNWTCGRIEEANRFAKENGLTPFALGQMYFSLAQTTPMQIGDVTQLAANDVEIGYYKHTGMPLMAFGAMSRGYFQKKLAGLPLSAPLVHMYDYIPENILRTKRLGELCEKLGKTPSYLLAAYIINSGVNASALCAFSSVAQLEDVMTAAGAKLDADLVSYLENGK